MRINNVSDRRHNWIGSWEAEPLDVAVLTEADKGRTVIYRAPHCRIEAGTLSSWNERTVWARFSTGDTAASCNPDDLVLGAKSLDGPHRT